MTITAQIIADSVSTVGPRKRLTTMQLRYPRFIHAEELTHRVLRTTPDEIIIQKIADGLMYDENLSRNASSSRAIPVERLIKDVLDDTAMPIHWGKNQPGMQARLEHDAPVFIPRDFDGEDYDGGIFGSPDEAWLSARDAAIAHARAFAKAGYHKQIVNRLLESFSHINVVVTASEWANFFGLRDHPDAQPEICALARAMKAAMEASTPIEREPGTTADSWHLPYVTDDERTRAGRDNLIRMSVARCARVSYLTTEGKTPTIAEDLALYDRLVGSAPLHASPAEHQATPDDWIDEAGVGHRYTGWDDPARHGNLIGWIQYRKLLPNENIT